MSISQILPRNDLSGIGLESWTVLEQMWAELPTKHFRERMDSMTGRIISFIRTKALLQRQRKRSNLPPGPWGLPLIGYIPFLGSKMHITLNELSKKHGDIFSLYIGGRLVVVLNSYEAIKEAFIKQADIFAGRFENEFTKKGEPPTIFASEGDTWKDYKRFTLRTLRDFGFGKLSIEPRIKEEVFALLKTLEDYEGKPMDVADQLRMSVSNVICTLIRGRRFEYNDKTFQNLIKILNVHFKNFHPIDFRLYFPKLLLIPGFIEFFGFTRSQPTRDKLLNIIRKLLVARTEKHNEGENDDYINAWLTEAKRRGPENGKNFTNEHLVQVVLSLFAAGTDTTANTLRWAILLMMDNPGVQARVQKELDEVVGKERMPSTTDRDQLPYTEATLLEIQRKATLLPLALPHCNIEETTLLGYHIPKRSVVLPNLWAVHFDPKIYPEPEKFCPEHFLNKNGKVLKSEKLIPFSIGKRECLGESLAKMELFIYFSSLLQKFNFTKPEGDKLCFDYAAGMVSIPYPFKTIAEVRS